MVQYQRFIQSPSFVPCPVTFTIDPLTEMKLDFVLPSMSVHKIGNIQHSDPMHISQSEFILILLQKATAN